eukprot:6461535-Amphidinium_carterae.2
MSSSHRSPLTDVPLKAAPRSPSCAYNKQFLSSSFCPPVRFSLPFLQHGQLTSPSHRCPLTDVLPRLSSHRCPLKAVLSHMSSQDVLLQMHSHKCPLTTVLSQRSSH